MANVPLQFAAADGKEGEFFVGGNPTSFQTTNASGEAVFEWIPDWDIERMNVMVPAATPHAAASRSEQSATFK